MQYTSNRWYFQVHTWPNGISVAKIENVLEHVYLLRPSAGAGVSAVDVWLLLSNVRG